MIVVASLTISIAGGLQHLQASSYEHLYEWGEFGILDPEKFSHPQFIDVDKKSGDVYVTDYGNKRVQKFAADGSFILQWGESGKGDGQFRYPTGIASDDSHVYVVDRTLNRVQKFTHNGTYVLDWGEKGKRLGQMYLPEGIAIHNGSAYVVDTGNSRIQEFTTDGEFVSSFGSSGIGDGDLLTPYAIHIDSNGTIYVTDKGNQKIEIFSLNGTNLDRISFIGHDKFVPGGIHVDEISTTTSITTTITTSATTSTPTTTTTTVEQENVQRGIYVTDTVEGGLYYFVPSTNSTILPAEHLIESSSPRYTNIAMGINGELYVVDAFNHSIQTFTTPSYTPPTETDNVQDDEVSQDSETDNVQPTLVIPQNITTDANDLYTNIHIGEATATDQGGIHAIINNSPSKFPLGVTTVTWFAYDKAGNVAKAEQYITVLACGMPHTDYNTIKGTVDSDTITGTHDSDLIFGFSGNDNIIGNGGDDCIIGGYGNDVIFGGSGDDTILGNQNDDIIKGESGNDTLYGGPGTDTGDGGPGTDTCHGNNSGVSRDDNDVMSNCEIGGASLDALG